jgi:C4-dicarboxylate transporter DctM subunit
MNLFTIKTITGAPMVEAIGGSLPCAVLTVLVLAVVTESPYIALWLPGTMVEQR